MIDAFNGSKNRSLLLNGNTLLTREAGLLTITGIDGAVVVQVPVQADATFSLRILSPGLYIARLGTSPALKIHLP